MILSSPAVCIKDTGTDRGRGVFALKPYSSGDVVEVCPVLVFAKASLELPEPFDKRVFDWAVLAGAPPASSALALGYGSMYNHANPANMRYEADAPSRLMRFIAVRDIDADQELTINYNGYGGVAEWPEDHWFERMGIKPLP